MTCTMEAQEHSYVYTNASKYKNYVQYPKAASCMSCVLVSLHADTAVTTS